MPVSAVQQYKVLQIFQAVFNAAPGAALLSELESFIGAGNSYSSLIESLTGTSAFPGNSYPANLSHTQFADAFLTDLLADRVSNVAFSWARQHVLKLLDAGHTQTGLITELTQALSQVAPQNTAWWGAASYYNTSVIKTVVDNLVGDTASAAAKANVNAFILSKMAKGQSLGQVLEWAVKTLDIVDHSHAVWGGAASLFDNRAEVAKFYAVTQAGNALDLNTLQEVLAKVTASAQSVAAVKAMFATPLNGKVLDGYLAGATIFVDLNHNGVLDTNETSVKSDAFGNFVLPGNAFGTIVAKGGVDISTNQSFTSLFTAPAGSSIVSPLTTLIKFLADTGVTTTQAQSLVLKAFGLPSTSNLLTLDPIRTALGTGSSAEILVAMQVQAANTKLANILSLGVAAIHGSDNKVSTTVAMNSMLAAFSKLVASTNSTLDLTQSNLLLTLITTAADDGKTPGIPDPHLNDLVALMSASSTSVKNTLIKYFYAPADALSELVKLQSVVQGSMSVALVSGIKAGSTDGIIGAFTGAELNLLIAAVSGGQLTESIAVTTTVSDDDLPPLVAHFNAATDDAGTITGAVASGGVTDDTALVLSGTNLDGSSIAVYDGLTLLGSATVSGTNWTFTATIADGITYQFNVKETDADGKLSAPTNNYIITGDTTAPAVALGSASLTNIAAPIISGTAEVDAVVTVEVAGATYTTIATGGLWSVDTSSASPVSGSLSLNTNGSNAVSVTAVDAAGNASLSAATQTLIINTAGPGAPTALTLTPSGGVIVSNALNASNTHLDVSATIIAGEATGGSAALQIDGVTVLSDTQINAGDTSVNFSTSDGTPSNAELQAAIVAGGVVTVVLTDLAGNSSTSVINPTLLVDYLPPSAASGITLTPSGGTVVADTLNTTNTQLDVQATIVADEAIGGSAVLQINNITVLADNLIEAGDTTLTFTTSDGSPTSNELQALIGAGGVVSIVLTDAVGNTVASTVGNPTLTVEYTTPTANFSAVTDDVGSITGIVSSGGISDDTALELSGSNLSGSSIAVYDGLSLLGSATVTGTSWSYTATVVDGVTYQFNIRETDSIGNTGAPSSSYQITGDTTAPTANINIATDDIGTVTGTIASGGVTDDTALVLSGSNEVGSSVNVYDGLTLLGSATITGTSWTYTATIVDGATYQFNAKETDLAGNTSAATANYTITGDTSAPIADITTATDNIGTVTGTVSSGGVTDDTALVLSGSNETGSAVAVYDGLTLLGSATVTGTSWSYTATIADGVTYQFNAKETDLAGNTSAATANYTVTGDTTAPTANISAATDDIGSVTGTITSGGVTDDTALVLSGSNEAGSSVTVYDGLTLLGSATVTGTSWTYTATIADGVTYQFNVKETDLAGNASAATSDYTITGDTTAPTAVLVAATDDVGSVTGIITSGGVTDDTAPVLSGSNESGSTVAVYDGLTLLGSATITGTSWTYTATIADGITYQFNAKETDTVGNISAATANYTITGDTSAPIADITTATDDVGTVTGAVNSGGVTDDAALVLSGSNEVGSAVAIYDGLILLGSATVSGTSWSYTATIADGITYQFNAKETDTAGNTSAVSAEYTITGDTTAPTANISAATDDVGSVTGIITSGGVTDDTALVLSGSNEVGSNVTVYDGLTLLGSATVTGTSWTYSATIADGATYQFNTKETDLAGNTSAASGDYTITGDTTAPTANISAATDDVGTVTGTVSSGAVTDDTALVLSGSNEVGSSVAVYDGLTLLGAASVSGTSWTYTATIADGVTYQFNAKETDLAGNTSAATSDYTITGDTTAPTANISAATDDVGTVTGIITSGGVSDDTALVLSGSNESGSAVAVYDGLTLLGSATVTGTSWTYTATIADGVTYQFNTKETDTAGNTSAVSAEYTITGDMTAPTANISAATDDVGIVTGTVNSGDVTDDTALLLSGSNEVGSSVNVYDGLTLLGSATVTGTSWTYTATIADGITYQFNAKETDTAGNTSTATANYTITGDTTAPIADITTATDDVGTVTGTVSSGGVTDDTALVLSGSNETNSTVNIYDGLTLLGSATITGTSWTYTATIADGVTYQFNVKETDLAGNTSTATANYTVTGDTSAPTAVLAAATDDVGTVTGAVNSGGVTDDTTLVLSGSNETGSAVAVYDGLTLLGSATITGTSWTYTATIADGVTYQFNAKETDLAGNTSAASSDYTITGDTTAPTAPANLTLTPSGGFTVSNTLNTSNTHLDVAASIVAGEATGGSAEFQIDGITILSDTQINSGDTSITFTTSDGTPGNAELQAAILAGGVASVVLTDLAGNSSTSVINLMLTLDYSAPVASVQAATISSSDSAVVQSTEIGSAYLVRNSVTVSDLNSILSAGDSEFNETTITMADSNTTLLATGLTNGTYNVYTADEAGNLSAPASNTVLIDSIYTVTGVTLTLLASGAIDLTGATDLDDVTSLIYATGGNAVTMNATQFKAFTSFSGSAGLDEIIVTEAVDDGAGASFNSAGTNFNGIENLNFAVGTNKITFSRTEYVGFLSIVAPGTDTFGIEGSGSVTAFADIEAYELGDDSSNARTFTTSTTSVTLLANNPDDTITVDASDLAEDKTLTLAALSSSTLVVTDLTGDLDAKNHTGLLTVTTGNAVDNTISIAIGSGSASINVAAGMATDTLSIDAAALLDNNELTVISGAAAIGAVSITGLAGNLNFSDPGSGSLSVAVADNTGDDTITISAVATNLAITNVADGDTLTIGSFTGAVFTGALAGTTGKFNITAGVASSSFTTGAGNDVFTFAAGSGLTSADTVSAGAGTDTIILTGNTIVAATNFNKVSNIEVITLENTNTAVSITTLDALVAAGATLTLSNAANSGILTFNGVAETDGSFNITGGAGNDIITAGLGVDTFNGGAGNDSFSFKAVSGLTSADFIDGGAGTDTVTLTGNTAFAASNYFDNVFNIEVIKLGNTSTAVNIVTLDSLVAAAATLTVSNAANAGALTFDGSAETNGILIITGGSGNDIITGGAGSDTLTAGLGNDALTGGAGNDTFTFLAVTGLTSADIVDGGIGTDKVSLTGNTAFVASNDFDNVSNIETITLGNTSTAVSIITKDTLVAAGATLTLSAATNTGVMTFDGAAETDGKFTITSGSGNDIITGGTGNDLITSGLGNDTLSGGDGNDTFTFVSVTGLTSADSVDGGNGIDIISLTGNFAFIASNDFDNVSNIETIKLGNTSTAVSIITKDTLLAAGATLTLSVSTSSGALTFNGAAETDGSFIITGGSGNDIITGGTGNDLITSGLGNDTLSGGTGDDTFTFVSVTGLTSTDTVDGGDGIDIISLTGNTAFAASNYFDNVSNIETIKLGNTSTVVNIVTKNTLVATGATLTLSISASSGALTFNGAAETDGSFIITGGKGNDNITGGTGDDLIAGVTGNDTLKGGDGNDTFTFAAGSGLTTLDAVDGGNGYDTVALTANTAVAATNFNGVSNIELITLSNTTTTVAITTLDTLVAAGATLTLSNAANTGILTFIGTAETDGSFDITGGSGNDIIRGGLGNDSFLGGNGNDIFTFAAVTGLTSADTVDGENGTDTLALTGNTAFTATNDFDNVFNIETITLGNTSSLVSIITKDTLLANGATLTVSNAANAGNLNFDGSAETDGKFVITGGTGVDTIIGSSGNDSFKFVAVSGLTSADTVDGGDGSDTITLSGNTIFAASNYFDNVRNIETIVVANTSTAVSITTLDTLVAAGATLTLATPSNSGVLTFNGAAETDGSFSITGGKGSDVITGGANDDTLSAGTGSDKLYGGDGNDTFIFAAGSGLTSADIIDGGDGIDTVALTGVTAVAATNFNGVKNVEVITLSNTTTAVAITTLDQLVAAGATLTLSNAASSGILTFNGTAETNGAFIITGGASADIITGGAGADIITGGTGSDTLKGGAGADIYNYTALTDGSAIPGAGDTILTANFVSGSDSFNFSDAAFGLLGLGALTAAADTGFNTNQALTLSNLIAQADSEIYRAVFTGSSFDLAFYTALDTAFAGGGHTGAAFMVITNGTDSRVLYDADTSIANGLIELVKITGASTLTIAASDFVMV